MATTVRNRRRTNVVRSDPPQQDGTPFKRPLETAIAETSSDLAALEARVTTAEGDIDNLEAADVALDGRLDVLEALAVVEDMRLDALEADVADHESRLTTAEGDINAVEADLAAHAADVDAHKGQKHSIELDAGDLHLVGDEAAPGNNQVYGTDGSGNKGWKADPAGGGDVVGPAGATDEAIALFDGATGKLLQDSGVLLVALALLAGRAGGQTLKGGTAAGENLTLQGTDHATPGKVVVASSQLSGTAQYKALVYRSTQQLIATATATAVQFTDEDYDVGTLHDTVTNNTRLTAPVAGYYLVHGAVTYEANGTGSRATIMAKNGAIVGTQASGRAGGTLADAPFLCTIVHLNAGDYLELWAYQDTGGNLNVGGGGGRNTQPQFGMILLWGD